MPANPRGAGRKKALPQETINQIRERAAAGEKQTALAAEYGVSRQTISSYLQKEQEDDICRTYRAWVRLNRTLRQENLWDYTLRIEYMNRQECCTVILVDFFHEHVLVENLTDHPLYRAFGVKEKPDWNDFCDFLEERCVPRTRFGMKEILKDYGLGSFDPLSIIEKTGGHMAEDHQWMKLTYFDRMEAMQHADDRSALSAADVQ
jgi:transcriptional regulator with XRE-family HTH domain